jgi:hypothetical protein
MLRTQPAFSPNVKLSQKNQPRGIALIGVV